VLKVLAVVGGAGLEGGIMRLWVSVLVEGVRERAPSVFGGWWVGRVVGWRNTAEDTDPVVGVGLSRIRAEREEGAL
jgi:hypothetical protein